MDGDERVAGHHRLLPVRAHLLKKTGDTAGAYECYRRVAKSTAALPSAATSNPGPAGWPPGDRIEASGQC
ncbi:hypothetical protein ACFTXM_15315 [Streptomyces sp. NPDC056930]|uniref:hypothetical protein n=1 Tax=Streptomyces sp. NPDC056930 TaxID=3345967 RepID=UPI003642116C